MLLQLPNDIGHGVFFRTLGPGNSEELLGGGYMYKKYSGGDLVNNNNWHYALCYVINGTGSYLDSWGTEHKLRPGSFFQRFPDFIHSNYIDEPDSWQECFICFSRQFCDSLIKMGLVNPRIPCGFCGLSNDIIESFMQIRRKLESAEEEELGAVLPQMLALHYQIISTSKNMESSENMTTVSLACQILSSNIEQKLDLQLLCRKQGWGYEKFRKLFKSHTGISPAQYRIRRRIDKARQMLISNRTQTLETIAAELGYSSVYEFSSQFKKITGLSPGRFRNG